MKIRVILAALVTLLVGCHQIFGESKIIRVSGAASISKQDEAIIAARLGEHTSSLSPAYKFSNSHAETTIEVKGAPTDAAIQFLLMHRGIFKVKSESGIPWFSQSDIVYASSGFDDQQRTVLNLKLDAKAANRVASLSADENGLGTLISAVLDGETLVTARVSSPITNGMLQLTLNKPPKEAMYLCTLLKAGPLSFAPVAVHVEAQP